MHKLICWVTVSLLLICNIKTCSSVNKMRSSSWLLGPGEMLVPCEGGKGVEVKEQVGTNKLCPFT